MATCAVAHSENGAASTRHANSIAVAGLTLSAAAKTNRTVAAATSPSGPSTIQTVGAVLSTMTSRLALAVLPAASVARALSVTAPSAANAVSHGATASTSGAGGAGVCVGESRVPPASRTTSATPLAESCARAATSTRRRTNAPGAGRVNATCGSSASCSTLTTVGADVRPRPPSAVASASTTLSPFGATTTITLNAPSAPASVVALVVASFTKTSIRAPASARPCAVAAGTSSRTGGAGARTRSRRP